VIGGCRRVKQAPDVGTDVEAAQAHDDEAGGWMKDEWGGLAPIGVTCALSRISPAAPLGRRPSHQHQHQQFESA
jgi:hypothetical protein